MIRTSLLAAALSLACLGACARATHAASSFEGLPADVRAALERGEVVSLGCGAAGTTVRTRFAALVAASPECVVRAIRDYEVLQGVFPSLQSVSVERGSTRDVVDVRIKPHPMLPLIDLSREVLVAWEPDGDAHVDQRLLRSSYGRLADQRWQWRLERQDDGSTLALYETSDAYTSLPFKGRVVRGMEDAGRKLVLDVRRRSLPAPAPATARLARLGE